MTRMSLAERRQKLVEAALAVIARSGVAGATTRAIAAEAGMPLASFHYAFESHQVLLAEATQRVLDEELARAAAVELQGASRDELFANLLRQHLTDVKSRPDEYRRVLELVDHAFRTPGQEEVPARWHAARRELLGRRLAEHAEQQGMDLGDDVATMAEALLILADGLTQGWLVNGDAESLSRVTDVWTGRLAG